MMAKLALWQIKGILPKGPYPPCLRMADRALLAEYPRNEVFQCMHHWVTMSYVSWLCSSKMPNDHTHAEYFSVINYRTSSCSQHVFRTCNNWTCQSSFLNTNEFRTMQASRLLGMLEVENKSENSIHSSLTSWSKGKYHLQLKILFWNKYVCWYQECFHRIRMEICSIGTYWYQVMKTLVHVMA